MTDVRRFDVIIVGGGPAGIAAAVTSSASGARVAMVDEGSAPGGQIWRDQLGKPSSGAARRWKTRLAACGAELFASASVVDARRTDGGFSVLVERMGEALALECERLVIATGARERFVPFPGWTLPNVIGVGGAQALLKTGMSVRGRRVVIAGSGPLLFPVAASMAAAGAEIALVAEQASMRDLVRYALSMWRTPGLVMQAARLRAAFARTTYATGTWVARANGRAHVTSVTVTDGRHSREIECEVLCTAFGLVPNTELARLLGCETRQGTVVVDVCQATSVPGVYCAGEPTGIGGVDLSLVEGSIAGKAATGDRVPSSVSARRERLLGYARRLEQSFALRGELRTLAAPDTIVCRCEDVRLGDLHASWTTRQAKLYTRAGMGACQGRICGAALECLMGWPPDTVRPPIQPARLTTLLADVHASERPRESPQGVS